ncbi:5708_t:CDS:2 [Funneliformis geosporum]|nr:5708_t:CDS:2 [Funneliformis geosporum]
MEYADGGALRKYLKDNFYKLKWEDKYNFAFQLASAVSCLHDEGIVHRDLHSSNILIRKGMIKLADFGLLKRIEEATKQQSKVFGVIPYIDPKSGRPPVYVEDEQYDIDLAIDISQGLKVSFLVHCN